MLSILLVEDEQEKVRLLTQGLLEVPGITYDWLDFAPDVISAKKQMQKKSYDVVLLDINLPKRVDQMPNREGGLEILRWLRSGGRSNRPQYLIATTAYDQSMELAQETIDNLIWSLIPFDYAGDAWKAKIKEAMSLIIEGRIPPYRNDGVSYRTDLGIVVALEDVELKSILALPANWERCKSRFEETRYYSGRFSRQEKSLSVVVVAAPNKGMPFTAVTASKMIAAFRPKYLAMTGICAGISGRVKLGDAIFADPSWDWGGGKVVESDSKQQLQGAPYQHRLDESLRLKAQDLRRDVGTLAQIRAKWQGSKPESEIAVHIGAVASGASVLQSAKKMKELVDSHKDLRGIEMEIFAALCAADYAADPKPIPFAVKSVCDFGDKTKSDSYQEYAAFVSANILYEFALDHL